MANVVVRNLTSYRLRRWQWVWEVATEAVVVPFRQLTKSRFMWLEICFFFLETIFGANHPFWDASRTLLLPDPVEPF